MQVHGRAETDAIEVTEFNTSAIAPQLQNRAVIGFSETNRVRLCTAMRIPVLDSMILIIFFTFHAML